MSAREDDTIDVFKPWFYAYNNLLRKKKKYLKTRKVDEMPFIERFLQ